MRAAGDCNFGCKCSSTFHPAEGVLLLPVSARLPELLQLEKVPRPSSISKLRAARRSNNPSPYPQR
jgi:hypothetical protein